MKNTHRWPHTVFGLLNLALTMPGIYLMLGLPLIMRQHGWSGTEIGLFQLAGLPALFKFFLGTTIEHNRPARRPYTLWAMATGGGYLLTLLILSSFDVNTDKSLLFPLVLLSALMGTWADIPVNALAIKHLPETERVRAGGIRSAALFAGAIAGGGIMLFVYQAFGWATPFFLMSFILLLALVLLSSLKETADHTSFNNISGTPLFPTFKGFFQQTGGWGWSLLLLSYFPFTATAWLYLKPLLLDQGLSPDQAIWIAGIGGGGLGALSSLLTARFAGRQTLPRLLPLCAAANFLVLALLTGAVWLKADPIWLMGSSFLLALSMGATSTLAFSVMMDFARMHRQAMDYGIQTSLFTVGRLAIPPVAGILLDHYHYTGMLLALTAASFGVFILTRLNGHIFSPSPPAPSGHHPADMQTKPV